MTKGKELQVLDIKNLTEFNDATKKQTELVANNPFVKCVDTKTYNLAKKHRTALKTGRVEIQNNERLLATKIRQFRLKVQDMAINLVGITIDKEDKQQKEIDRYEAIIEKKRIEREEKRKQQVEAWAKKSSEILDYLIAITNATTPDEVLEIKKAVESIDLSQKEFGEYLTIAQQNKDKVMEVANTTYERFVDAEQKAEQLKVELLITARAQYRNVLKTDAPEDLDADQLDELVRDELFRDPIIYNTDSGTSEMIELGNGKTEIKEDTKKPVKNKIINLDEVAAVEWGDQLSKVLANKPHITTHHGLKEDVDMVADYIGRSIELLYLYKPKNG